MKFSCCAFTLPVAFLVLEHRRWRPPACWLTISPTTRGHIYGNIGGFRHWLCHDDDDDNIQQIPTSYIPTRWESVIMTKGGNVTRSHILMQFGTTFWL